MINNSFFPKYHIFKDSIIRNIYYNKYNIIYQHVECAGFKFDLLPKRLDNGQNKRNMDLIGDIKNQDIKMYLGHSNDEFVLFDFKDNDNLGFVRRIESLGFKATKLNIKLYTNAVNNLDYNSYITRDYHNENKLKLTEKGINHHNSGMTFMNAYVNRLLVILPILISVLAFLISIIF